MEKKSSYKILKNNNLSYKGIDLGLTVDQLHDLRIQLGWTNLEIIEHQYSSVIENNRVKNLEILLH
jgi:hypothetical protein